MKYKLLAADMDSTALNSKKELTPNTVAAMEKAIEQGKIIAFSTGRSISLVQPYIDQVRGMRYAVTGAGASVIDTYTGKKISYETIDPETVKYIAARAAGYVMPIFFIDDKTYSSAWCVDNCADFGLGAYEPIYRQGMNLVDDVFAMFMADPKPVEKLNLFFAQDGEADAVYEQIKNLPVSFTCHSPHCLEINASGVSKAKGLRALCAALGIDMSECIAIGDAQNDEEMLKAAGLKVAMENGSKAVKALADAGNEVMNHSSNHAHFSKLSEDEIVADVTACNQKIAAVTGVTPTLFRCPYGEYDDHVIKAVSSTGTTAVQWDVDSLDWKGLSAKDIQSRVLKNVQPGSIVLFHNAAENTPEALPGIIESLLADGYTIVPISQLLLTGEYTIDHAGRQCPK